MTDDAAIYRAPPTDAALQLASALLRKHPANAPAAARELLLRTMYGNGDAEVGIVLEAYGLLNTRSDVREAPTAF